MKKIIFVLVVFLLLATTIWGENTRILVLLPDNFGANCLLFMEVFEQLGFEIITAGITDIVEPCSAYAAVHGVQPVEVDYLTSEITDVATYDCVCVMSSTQYGSNDPCSDLINDINTLLLLYYAEQQNICLWATCSGVRVLAAADVINGCNVTGAAAFADEYEYAGATFIGGQLPPVVDGNIITTTRGQYFMHQNTEVILSLLAQLETRNSQGGEK